MNDFMQKKSNPLAGFFRQPKIYLKLPSNGEFYPPGSLDRSMNQTYPVYAMTAKDELMFKTPDALLSGQSTVEVIKSCIPAITDPWRMPSIDVDAALIAIRIATYGDKLEVECHCPHCNEENSYEINLVDRLDHLTGFHYESVIHYDPLVIHIRPYTYQELTQTNLKTFEQQRILSVINDDKMSEEEKIKRFGESFVKLTELTVDIICKCIAYIESPNGTTDDPEFIKEFIDNAPREIFDKVSAHITALKTRSDMPDIPVKCNSCQGEFEMPITLDQSNFFEVRS